MKRTVTYLSLFSLILFLVACHSTNKGNVTQTINETTKITTTDTSAVDKYGAYILFDNQGIELLYSMENNYFIYHTTTNGEFKEISAESEQFFYENNTTTVKELDELTQQLDTVKSYLKKKPTFFVDDELSDLIPLIEEEKNIYNDIFTYYSNKTYTTDNYAKGKELHDSFLKLFISISSNIETFRSDMEKLSSTQEDNLLKQESLSGTTANKMLELITSANELSLFFSDSITDSVTLSDTYNSADFETFSSNYDSDYSDLTSIDDSTLEKEKIDQDSFKLFLNQASILKTKLADTLETIKTLDSDTSNTEAQSSFIDSAKNYDEQISLLIHYYNQVIEQSE